jgi:hypothetical protein
MIDSRRSTINIHKLDKYKVVYQRDMVGCLKQIAGENVQRQNVQGRNVSVFLVT